MISSNFETITVHRSVVTDKVWNWLRYEMGLPIDNREVIKVIKGSGPHRTLKKSDSRFYEPHELRVVAERCDLNEKLVKLESFIQASMFDKLDSDEQLLLRRQLVVMREYSKILTERIEKF